MGKLTKTQLKAITDKAKKIRTKGGVKEIKKVTVYKKKWTSCIKEAAVSLGYTKKRSKQMKLNL